jgi:hypothetical protein
MSQGGYSRPVALISLFVLGMLGGLVKLRKK